MNSIAFQPPIAFEAPIPSGFIPAMPIESPTSRARAGQPVWAATPIQARLAILRRARHLLAENAEELAGKISRSRGRPIIEVLTAELLPLLDAFRFLERRAKKILAPRRLGASGRPLWLSRVESEIRREPMGIVLLIAPSNYSLFLSGVQAIQALAAGNAVLLKPGDNGSVAAHALKHALEKAGLDERLFGVLSESPEAAQAAIEAGVDKVVLTGSAETGVQILRQLAPHLTPATMELSGCDAVFLRADADLDLVVKALRFGLQLNGGATCIAPRRVFVPHSLAAELESKLAEAFQSFPPIKISPELNRRLLPLLIEALSQGARLVAGQIQPGGQIIAPVILAEVGSELRLFWEDIFAPVLSLMVVNDEPQALAFSAHSPYALGATIFSRDANAARELAARLRAGIVLINDLIVPTVDPRLPFGGRGRSGFGSTRGAEGLLEMTAVKVVSRRRGSWRPHFDPPVAEDAKIFSNYITTAHGSGWRSRAIALGQLLRWLACRGVKQVSISPNKHSAKDLV